LNKEIYEKQIAIFERWIKIFRDIPDSHAIKLFENKISKIKTKLQKIHWGGHDND
jgi:hypothetical protein